MCYITFTCLIKSKINLIGEYNTESEKADIINIINMRHSGDEVTFNNVRHSLPTQKKRPKKQHSLAADVQSNRPVSKK